MKKIMYSLAFAPLLSACADGGSKDVSLLDKAAFDTVVNGQPVSLYTLNSGNGLVLQVTNYGLRVVSLWVPDKNGNYSDVSVGYENIERYINNEGERFLGPIVGRYANRIANGAFKLDGVEYHLPQNNNGQTLHGGIHGLDRVVWKVDNANATSIRFSYLSPDGDEGFPGNLKIVVEYSVTPENEFKITYEAETDKPTVVNLSNHAFFNLKGEGSGSIADHILTINADYITPVNTSLIPTGELMPVDGTPFNFRTPVRIGERIGYDHEQLKNGGGYDHNWVLAPVKRETVELAVTLYEPQSGRTMEVYTDQPGVQFYSGNFFDGKANGKYGKPINFREALALETQH
ncbi:MAG: galactose mutarotase, partial [Prevotellaceae bacterium]|nr:galactose mutarotase [Prevotellaceae bacterium]